MLRKILKLWIVGGLTIAMLPALADFVGKEWEQVSSLAQETLKKRNITRDREIILEGTVTERNDTLRVTRSNLLGDVTYVVPLDRTTLRH